MGGFTALTALRIAASKVASTLPTELAKLSRLLTLDFSNNAISGAIPPALWSLQYLKEVDLSGNPIG